MTGVKKRDGDSGVGTGAKSQELGSLKSWSFDTAALPGGGSLYFKLKGNSKYLPSKFEPSRRPPLLTILVGFFSYPPMPFSSNPPTPPTHSLRLYPTCVTSISVQQSVTSFRIAVFLFTGVITSNVVSIPSSGI